MNPTALQAPAPDHRGGIGRAIRGITIGIDRQLVSDGIGAEVAAAVTGAQNVRQNFGARTREIRFPPTAKLVRG